MSHWYMFFQKYNHIFIEFMQYALPHHCGAQGVHYYSVQCDSIVCAHLSRHCYPLVVPYWLTVTFNSVNVQGSILSYIITMLDCTMKNSMRQDMCDVTLNKFTEQNQYHSSIMSETLCTLTFDMMVGNLGQLQYVFRAEVLCGGLCWIRPTSIFSEQILRGKTANLWPSVPTNVRPDVHISKGGLPVSMLKWIFCISDFFPWTRQFHFHCKESMDLALEGRDEGDPLSVWKWPLDRVYVLASLGLSRSIKFRRIRDHPHCQA